MLNYARHSYNKWFKNRHSSRIDAVEKGAYMSISKEAERVECILITTSSEVKLTIRVKK